MHTSGLQRWLHVGSQKYKYVGGGGQVRESLKGQAEKLRLDAQGILKQRNDRTGMF